MKTSTLALASAFAGLAALVTGQSPGDAWATSLQLPQGSYMPEPGIELPAPARSRGGLDERVFRSGFELPVLVEHVSTYDDLEEAFAGTSFHYDGITYREVNEVSGFYPGPENEPFGPGALVDGGVGNQFIIEDATYLFKDFPEFGSAPNVLNFGDLFFSTPGPNVSLGPLVSTWMDLDEAADAVGMALVYYENGTWGGIELRLDAYLGETLVGSDMLTITSVDPDGRDNVTTNTLAIDGVRFDTLHLYAVRESDGAYTVPRVMIDDLSLTVDYTPPSR